MEGGGGQSVESCRDNNNLLDAAAVEADSQSLLEQEFVLLYSTVEDKKGLEAIRQGLQFSSYLGFLIRIRNLKKGDRIRISGSDIFAQ